jgi:tetratricopeptide (TPR) repeat protein
MEMLELILLMAAGAPAQAPAKLAELHAMVQRGRELLASGRHQESRRHFEKLARTATQWGPVHESIALEWLGSTYVELRRLTEAERALARCVKLRESLWSVRNRNDPNHARILTSLGGVELALRRFRQAGERLDQARDIWQRIPADRRRDEFATYVNNVALLDYAEGRYSDAAERLRELVGMWQDFFPADDRRLAQAKSNLAGVLSRLGFHDEADRFSSQSLAGFSAKLDQEPLVAAELLSVRSSVLRKAKREREAQRLEDLARDFLRKTELSHRIDISQLGRR